MNPQPATSAHIITIVVISIAALALIGVATLSYLLIAERQPDQVLLTAYVGITTGLVGCLSGLLINTRSSTHAPQQPVVETDPKNV